MRFFSLGFMAGVAFVVVLSLIDRALWKRVQRRRFDEAVRSVFEKSP